jgi:hypothetical protein
MLGGFKPTLDLPSASPPLSNGATPSGKSVNSITKVNVLDDIFLPLRWLFCFWLAHGTEILQALASRDATFIIPRSSVNSANNPGFSAADNDAAIGQSIFKINVTFTTLMFTKHGMG